MGDLFFGLAIMGAGYMLDSSVFNGDPAKYYYAFDIMGGLLCLSGLFKLIRGTKMDDR